MNTFAAAATTVLAQTPSADVIGAGETAVFWILGPLSVLGALGMVFARSAVHSALWLVLTMLSLGVLYMAQSAQFLGFTQIIVYTGAIMMLFLFVLMMVGRDSSDSVVEVLRGQRLVAALLGIGFALLMASGLARSLVQVRPAAPLDPWSREGGGAGGLGRLIFTDYLFPFEMTSALLITAALGAMVMSYGGKGRRHRAGQRQTVEARFRGEYARPSPLPGPGVYATANNVATPALLPDGSVAPESLSEILDNTPVQRLTGDRRAVSGDVAEPDAHSLTGGGHGAEEHRRGGDDGDVGGSGGGRGPVDHPLDTGDSSGAPADADEPSGVDAAGRDGASGGGGVSDNGHGDNGHGANGSRNGDSAGEAHDDQAPDEGPHHDQASSEEVRQ